MGAGAYVGRIGGLAAALGIGAAVLVGQGVASADTGDTSGSGSSSTTSSASSSSGASAADPKQPADEKADTTTDSTDTKTDAVEPTPKKKKDKSSASKSSTKPAHEAAESAPKKDPTASKSAKAAATVSTKSADEPKTPKDPTPTTSVAISSVATTADVTIEKPTQQPQAPVAVVTTAISNVVSAILNPFAGSSPTAPVASPLPWVFMAAGRQEFSGTPSLTKAVDPVTTSATVDPTPTVTATAATDATTNVSTTAATDPPTNVVAIPQTPLLTALGLQNLPIIGPLFVTPIVAAVNEIPIVSDILHPIFGYPVQTGLPPGSPQPQDVNVISFDGTPINVHFMPAAGLQAGQQAPTILDGPGLGMPGATNLNGTPLDGLLTDNLGVLGIATLRDAGYNVVTWDPRGEYFSGGVLEIDSPDFEARDVSAIISWVAQQPEAELDGSNDPRIGMVGASYGGGIQLVTAATDHRVDAIVPTIAWNTLNSSLYENQAYKSGWGTLLAGVLVATFARPNPALYPAAIYGDLTGMLTQAEQDLLAARGPGGTPDLVSQITAPTLLIQGTVDTLFPLQEANANDLIANGVPTKVLWFCGGHGLCVNDLLDQRDGALIEQQTLAWLDRYVKDDSTVSTGPQFEWVDQSGQYYSSNVYPVPPGNPIVTSSSTGEVLPLLPFIGGSGPLLGVLPIGGTKAINAINLTVPAATTTTYVVGAPQLTLTYSGTGESTHVYAQLIDDNTGLVLGNQVTPIPVTLDGQTRTITAPLEMVAATLSPGQSVTLQLVASAADYETITSLGELNVSSMSLSLPTADASKIAIVPAEDTTAA